MVAILVTLLVGATWLESTQPDFADGTYESNLYASWRHGGAVEFAPRFDLNDDGYIDLFVCDYSSTYIYWGSDSGYYPANRSTYPGGERVDCIAADLDVDGCPEFIVPTHEDGGVLIYQGTPAGPSPTQPSWLPGAGTYGAAAAVADFDRNSWLDLSLGGYGICYTTYIYWGDSTGFSTSRRTSLPGDQPCHNPEVGDFNRDGWLDYLQSNDVYAQHVFWGTDSGFSPSNRTDLTSPGSPRHHGKSTADLNADGWLDLVFTSAGNGNAFIYWGSSRGFYTQTTLAPGASEAGSCVGDFDNDGFLDIAFAGGQPKIYWGSDSGFSDLRVLNFGQSAGYRGMFSADLDDDGNRDIFLNRESGNSPVYWGPDFGTSTNLPTAGDYHTMYLEPGNIYDRTNRETYQSSVFDAEGAARWHEVDWRAFTPGGSSVRLAVRVGDVPAPDSTWSDWLEVTQGGPVPDSLDSRYIQYRATFEYETPAAVPVLAAVEIDYQASGAIAERPSDRNSGCHVWPSVTRGFVVLENSQGGATLHDVAGNERAELHEGRNDLRYLPSGIYFVRYRQHPAGRHRLVVQR